MTSEPESIQPQPGPQTRALECQADICFFGGAAGGSKTFTLLMDAARFVDDPKYRAVIFRREAVQITIEGGLWDTSEEIYGQMGAEPVEYPRQRWTFPEGSVVAFHHLKHEKTKRNHQGGQYAFIGFDELTHFTQSQFIYLISRNRTQADMTPYMRATCNPDADSWVYDWVRPFLKDDGKTPDPDKCGELMWFTIRDKSVEWVDEGWRDIDEQTGEEIKPKSFTFIPAYVSDNKYLGSDYVTNLRAQSKVEQDRLLRGLWVSEVGKAMFRHHKIEIVDSDTVPYGLRWVRYWDLADTEVAPEDQEPRKASGPDWTAGAKLAVWYPPEDHEWHDGVHERPILFVGDVEYMQREGGDKQDRIKAIADMDGPGVHIGIEREGGNSGKEVARDYRENLLKDYEVIDDRPTGDKVERAKPWRALAEHGRVKFVRGPWNAQVLWWVEHFPNQKKDTIDAISGGFPIAQERASEPDYVVL